MDAGTSTQLKVGELARATGLTVRTLHHYDEIGLLAPSGRSESGYRLYSQSDVARLHGIQALRQMGLPLAEIAALLEGRGAGPQAIIEQQLHALDQEIAQATELRARLGLIREMFAKGSQPDLDAWLQVLQEMATYGKYFNPQELKAIFDGFAPLKNDWAQLTADVQAVMQRGLAADAPEVQSLARRWMSLMLAWMDGDFDMMDRFGLMYEREPHGPISKDAPPEDVIVFIRKAIDLRWALTQKHFTREELGRFRHVPETEWQALDGQVRELIARSVATTSEEGRAVALQWLALMDRLTSGDRQLRDKMLWFATSEPLIAGGSPISPPVRAWLRASFANSC